MTATWPLPPLIPGDWRELSQADACAVLARYAAVELGIGLTPSADQLEFSAVRALRLRGAPQWLLIEAAADFPDGARGLLTFFYGPEFRILPAIWSPSHLQDFAWPSGVPEVESVLEYIRLSVNYSCGDHGRFLVVDSTDEIRAHAADGAILDQEKARAASTLVVAKADSGHRAKGTVMYSGALYRAEFEIEADGNVIMVDDDPIGIVAGVTESIRGAFRLNVPDPAPSPEPEPEPESAADALVVENT